MVLEKFSNLPEEELLLSLAGGDRLAFKQLYNSNYRAVLGLAIKLTKSRELAEDIVHDVFIKIWETKQTLCNVRHFRSYLFAICKNMTLNMLARASREAEILANLHLQTQHSEPDREIELNQQNRRELLHEAIEQLPVQRRKIFRLCKIDGNSYDTVASQMGISSGTVNDHIVKGTRAVKKYLDRTVKAEHMEIGGKLSYR